MDKFRIRRIRATFPCKRSVEIYNHLEDMTREFISKELKINFTEEIFHNDCVLRYNAFKEVVVYENKEFIDVSHKFHHKLLLLNVDYKRRRLPLRNNETSIMKYSIHRFNRHHPKTYFSLVVEEYDE